MRKVNIADPEFEYEADDPPGFRAGMFRFGKQLGATSTGASVYELAPGEAVCPYHYEYGEEEWVLALAGNPSVRHPDGTDVLEPWDIVCFPPGPEGAHQVRNDSDAPARVLMFSEIRTPAATVYPDSDKIAVWTGNRDDNLMTTRSSKVDYFHGETNKTDQG